MIFRYTLDAVYSWGRDKITTRGCKKTRRGKVIPRTRRPDGDAEAKAAHADAFTSAACVLHLSDDAPSQDDYGLRDQWAVKVIYSPADERPHDTDRVLNLVLDALIGLVWKDDNDKFVVESGSRVVRGDPLYPPGTTTVVIERVGGPYVKAKKPSKRAPKSTTMNWERLHAKLKKTAPRTKSVAR